MQLISIKVKRMATKFITVSIEIMHDKNLTPNQKFILAEIEQLTQLDRGCFASNKHFSELIGISIAGVSNAIQDLEKKRYIIIDNSDTKRNFGRKITIHSGVESSIHSGVESKENKTSSSSNQLDYDDFFNLWNEFASKNNKAKLAKLSDSRKKKITLRLKEYKNLLEIFTYVLKKSETSNFLLNGNFYTFDWLFENDTNILKVYEGKYDNGKSQEVVM
mgnify:CR=1 FL=1